MTTKTLRLSDHMLDAVRELGTAEHIEEATAMRKLLSMGYNLFLAQQYQAGRLTIRAVAHRMDLPLSEAMEALQRLGITGNTGMDDTLASLRSLQKSNR